MIFSDGDEDACTADYECYNLNKLIEKHTQMGEAEKAKKAGIHIIYVGVGYLVDPSHHEFSANNVASAKQIASGEKNYIEVGTFDKLDSSILDQVVKTLCSEIN
ncbi:hypothetical protein Y032_0047g1448 [Ancylostoma ceylanicum]|uniref:VWFA domain-containing protein n=1 Tax=Ancylostoma ceylanicum TaxID=53326 RepID=A0A016UAN0_9BILA|nr:hypothetical protein Y032_0047g1448 [Ancylostoma ceylanicum]